MALTNNNFDTGIGIVCPVYAVIDRISLNKKKLSCGYDLDIYADHNARDVSIGPIKTIYFNIVGDEFIQKILPVIVENGNVCQIIYEDCKEKIGEARVSDE